LSSRISRQKGADPRGRPAKAGESLLIAERVARACGTTRLADITGLDRLGIPVWQAVRPWSRSVSVHQGKGLDPGLARLGACMEAIECHCGEQWAGETMVAEYAQLPAAERLPAADDCAAVRGVAPPEPIAWTPAERIGAPGRLWAPAAAVSLDACAPRPSWVEWGSNGQGAGFDLDVASCKALFELIERDAYYSWLAVSFVDRGRDGLALASIEFDWFRALIEHLRGLDVGLRLFAPPAIVPVPVVVAELVDLGPEAVNLPFARGICAHADGEVALEGAIVEAAQSRLAEIAGARDDLALPRPAAPRHGAGVALPLPRSVRLHDFHRRFFAPAPPSASAAFGQAVAALRRAGYPLIGRVQLSPAGCPVTVVRMFVPGLAARRRRRRPPLA
jgi:ribosomal protein S12 methylthiotransferase accessory factor